MREQTSRGICKPHQSPLLLIWDGGGVGVMAFRLAQGLTWLAVAEKFVLGGGSI